MKRDLERRYRIVAGDQSVNDFTALLAGIRDAASDIRNPIGKTDTIEIRNAVVFVLNQAIDKIRTLKNNRNAHGRLDDTDDDAPGTGAMAEGEDLL